MLDVEAQPVEETHIDVGDPDKGEPGDEIAAPADVEHLELGDDEEERRDVVAEAVLAGEEIEEFPDKDRAAAFAFPLAPVAGLAEELFVGDGPGGAGDGDSQKQEISELAAERHEHGRGHSEVLTVKCGLQV